MQLPAILRGVLILPLLWAASADLSQATCPDSLALGEVSTLAQARGDDFVDRLDADRLALLAAPLAVPRPVGSAEHGRVRDHLVAALRRLGGRGDWTVELDSFTADTPVGQQKFDNILATWRPAAASAAAQRRIVLAAHYDSKRLADFSGATDSAVPCAILLLVAEALQKRLADIDQPGLGVQLVFLDGEEAFEQWTRADSLYGSRHLAGRWAREEGANPGCRSAGEVEALVLLDLIGGRDPRFYYSPYAGSGERLVAKEMRLFEELVAMETAIRPILNSQHRYFQWPQLGSGAVQDDQVPFQEAGVPTVHIIPQPFPPVWHTTADRLENVDWLQAADVGTIVYAWLTRKIGLAG